MCMLKEWSVYQSYRFSGWKRIKGPQLCPLNLERETSRQMTWLKSSKQSTVSNMKSIQPKRLRWMLMIVRYGNNKTFLNITLVIEVERTGGPKRVSNKNMLSYMTEDFSQKVLIWRLWGWISVWVSKNMMRHFFEKIEKMQNFSKSSSNI